MYVLVPTPTESLIYKHCFRHRLKSSSQTVAVDPCLLNRKQTFGEVKLGAIKEMPPNILSLVHHHKPLVDNAAQITSLDAAITRKRDPCLLHSQPPKPACTGINSSSVRFYYSSGGEGAIASERAYPRWLFFYSEGFRRAKEKRERGRKIYSGRISESKLKARLESSVKVYSVTLAKPNTESHILTTA